MESIATQVHKSLQSYWRRRTYRRLEGHPPPAKAERRRTIMRRGRRPGRVAVRIGNILRPKRLLARLRDAYMDAMLQLAGGRGAAVWERRIPKARKAGGSEGGDFDRRMIIHIYNSVVGTGPRELTSCC